MDHPFLWSNLTKTNKINNNNKNKYKLNSVTRVHIQANINNKNKYKRIKRRRLVSNAVAILLPNLLLSPIFLWKIKEFYMHVRPLFHRILKCGRHQNLKENWKTKNSKSKYLVFRQCSWMSALENRLLIMYA